MEIIFPRVSEVGDMNLSHDTINVIWLDAVRTFTNILNKYTFTKTDNWLIGYRICRSAQNHYQSDYTCFHT